jgi:hypothetical protein
MSQAGIISTSAGPVPPEVPTSFLTQNGTAIPDANILIVYGLDSSEDNANGIIAKGGVAGTGVSNEMDIVLTNRLQSTGTTVGAVTADIVTFALSATPGTYKFHFEVAAFESTNPAGLGYSIEASIRTTGAAATVISTPDADEDEDAVLATADWDVIASGNNAILRVTGVAGLTINWGAVGSYVLRG